MSDNNQSTEQQPIGEPQAVDAPAEQQMENPEVCDKQRESLEACDKQRDSLKSVVEALLFSSDKPLTVDQIRKVLDNLDAKQVQKIIEDLKNEYELTNRGVRVYEVAGGYQMIAAPMFLSFLRKLYKGPQSSDKLSKPALETLAIIAYKQPLSKMEIEMLRKVNVDGVMDTLMDRSLIRVVGRKKAPGRPKVFGTTRLFLEYFGLRSLDELPKIENFPVPKDVENADIEHIPEEQPQESATAQQPDQNGKNDVPEKTS